MQSISSMYDAWVDEPRGPRRSEPDVGKRLYLSAASRCLRKESLRLLRAPSAAPAPANKEAIAAGLLWESYLGAIVEASLLCDEIVIQRQAVVETPYGNGKIDILLTRYEDTDESVQYPDTHLIEIKCTTSERARYLPEQAHVDQLLLYLHFGPADRQATWAEERPKATGELTYALRDVRQVVSFDVAYDPARAAVLEGFLREVQRAVREGTPVPKNPAYAADHFPCGWSSGRCEYFANCYPGEA